MEVNMNTIAGQEMSLNNARTGQEILQKTQQKTEESRAMGQSVERPEIGRVSGPSARRIDIYA